MSSIIYYVFRDEYPSQELLNKKGYEDLEQFIIENTDEEKVPKSITGAGYDAELIVPFSEYLEFILTDGKADNEAVTKRIKNDLNIDRDNEPSLFVEDKTFKDNAYIKLKTNNHLLRQYLTFVAHLELDYMDLYKQQLKNISEDVPYINTVNYENSNSCKELVRKKRMYTDPLYQKCGIAIVDIEHEDIEFLDQNEFINELIWEFNTYNITTYYVNKQICVDC